MKLFEVAIPFTHKEAPGDHEHVVAWRRVFECHTFKGGLWIGESGQYFSKSSGKWRNGYGFHFLNIRFDMWKWERSHDYYDGPLDCLWLGPIQFTWQGAWCEKCKSSDE